MNTDFPEDFIFGFGTSSYQIEGAVSEGGREPSIWDTFCEMPGKIKDGSSGAAACNHYHLYKEDVKLMKTLNAEAYLFSIAWPRVMKGGVFNPEGIDFYSRLVDELLESGIEPFAKLYHWDLPQSLQDKGGWVNRDTAFRFTEYADAVSRKLGDRVKKWISHNEPWCVSFLGMLHGEFAPGYGDLKDTLTASHNLLLSHGLAAVPIRSNVDKLEYGIGPNYLPVYPASDSDEDNAAAARFDGYFNRWFFDPVFGKGYPNDMLEFYGNSMPAVSDEDIKAIAVPLDFIGINYYNALMIKQSPGSGLLETESVPMQKVEHSADREIYPQGLYDTLMSIQSDYSPKAVYITENGAAFDDPAPADGRVHDESRVNFLRDHFSIAQKALQDGVPLKGFFVWSLLDNFEWSSGYSLKYGVVHVDMDTQKRTVKDSGFWCRDVFGSGRLS